MRPSAWAPERPRFFALVAFFAGALIACAAGLVQYRDNASFAVWRFEEVAKSLTSAVETRMDSDRYGVSGLARLVSESALADGASVSRLQELFRSRLLDREFPGAGSYGYIGRAPADASATPRYAVQVVEPHTLRDAVSGPDPVSDRWRRETAEAALDTGAQTLSAPMPLAQASPHAFGPLLLMAPVFSPGPTPQDQAERRKRATGWVFATIRLDDVLSGLDYRDGMFSLVLLDASTPGEQKTLFESLPHAASEPHSFVTRLPLAVFGRHWLVEVRSQPEFLAHLPVRSPFEVVTLGFLLAGLCAGLVYSARVNTGRAHDMRAQNVLMARITENASDAILCHTVDGTITSWNEAATRLFGYSAEEAIGRTVSDLIVPNEQRAEQSEVLARIVRGEKVARIETLRSRRDGSWVEVAVASAAILDERGHILSVAKTITNISAARTLAREQRERTTRLEQEVQERTALLAAAVRESEALSSVIQRHALVSATDRAGRITDANAAFCRISGYSREELLGKDHRIVNSGCHDRAFWQSMWRTIAAGKPWRGELCNRAKDGSTYWVDTMIAPFLDAQGTVQKYISIRIDITAAKRTELELREANGSLQLATQQLAAAQRLTHVGSWELDLATGRVNWSDELFRIVGLTPGAVAPTLPEQQLSLYTPESWARLTPLVERAVTTGASYEVAIDVLRPDGSARAAIARGEAVLGQDGTAKSLVGTLQDVTEQRAIELALRTSEGLQRGILASAGSAIIGTDLSGTITSWNRAAEVMLGYEASEVVGVATPLLIHDAAEVEARRAALESEGNTLLSPFDVFVLKPRVGKSEALEWTYKRKDGSRLSVLLTVTSLCDHAGELLGYLGVAVDLSAQKRQENELMTLNRMLEERSSQAESANAAKSMFLANMSHEIRTPLNAVIGLTYLLEQTRLDADQVSVVAKIKLASRSLLGVINDVLDLSKIEAGEMEVEQHAIHLRTLLEELFSVMQVQAENKGIQLELQRAQDLPRVVRGDGVHLQQILRNLLSNAIKFTEHGHVTLSVTTQARGGTQTLLRFSVKDSGIGIEPEDQERLFAPFTQADASTTRRFGGTGLGLSIVKRLVVLMDGEISVSSALGAGSEFVVTLPFFVDDRVVTGPTRPLAVLVVGDDDKLCAKVAELARALGWSAECVASGQPALAYVERRCTTSNPVEVVIALVGATQASSIQRWTLRHVAKERRPAIVIASTDSAIAHDAALLGDVSVTNLRGELTASAVFNAVQEAIAERGIEPLMVGGHGPVDLDEAMLRGKHILVVDDSDINLEVARRVLTLQGAQVTGASTGQEALDLLRMARTTFDAVLMDIQMPVLDGIQATMRIRSALGANAPPIIALTAGALSSERQRATDAGMVDFISKPFEPRAMIMKLVQRLSTDAGKARPSVQTSGVERAPTANALPLGWPTLEGIDAHRAYASVAGDLELLRDMLRKLFEQSADLELPLGRAAQRQSAQALVASLHKLRGAAGTLGALGLGVLAGDWEQALREEQDTALEELGARFAAELRRLRSAASAFITGHDAARSAELPQRPAIAGDALAELIQLLERQSFSALEVFKALAPALQAQCGADVVAALGRAVDAFDYEEARRILETQVRTVARASRA